MPIQAQLHDGRVLEFPDGTNPQVIQATVKKVLGLAPSTERTWGEVAGDIGAAGVKGLGQVLQFPGELVGLVPGLRDFGEALATPGEYVANLGERLKSQGLKAREALRSQALSEAEKEGVLAEFATAITETIKDPALISTFLTEQVPQLLGPGAAVKLTRMLGKGAVEAVAAGAAREAAEKALRERAAAAAVGTGVAMQGADVGNDTYEAVYKLAIKQGMSEPDARALALEKARVAAFEAAAISLATARLPGGSAIERRMAGLPGGSRIGAGLKELGTEAAEEAGGAYAKGVAMAEVDPSISPLTGVGTAAGFGALGGFGLGTVVGGAPVNVPRAEPPAPIDVARQEAAKKEAERAAKAAAAAQPAAAPTSPVQTIIDETLTKPVSQAFAQLTQAIEELKQQPASPQRNAAIKELEAERGRREREDAERVQAGKKAAEGFLTAGQAATQTVTPRGEFDPTQARREEIERLRIERETLLVKGKPPAAKSPARRRFDELDARLVEIGGGRWTPPSEATAPTTPTVEEPAVPAVGLTEQNLFDLDITKRQPIFKRLLGKEPTDQSVLDDIEDYLNKGHGSEKSRTKLAEFKNRFAPKPPEAAAPAEPPPPEAAAPAEPPPPEAAVPTPPEPPSATSIPTEPGSTGAGVSVAGRPPAVSTAQGTGAVEPVRVVPPVEDAGRPAAGEGQQSAAVNTVNTPQSDALMDEIRALEQQRMSLLTKNGRIPAEKSPARKKYDELVDTIAQKKEQWTQMTRPQRGPVEAAETPAPTTIDDPKLADVPKPEKLLRAQGQQQRYPGLFWTSLETIRQRYMKQGVRTARDTTDLPKRTLNVTALSELPSEAREKMLRDFQQWLGKNYPDFNIEDAYLYEVLAKGESDFIYPTVQDNGYLRSKGYDSVYFANEGGENVQTWFVFDKPSAAPAEPAAPTKPAAVAETTALPAPSFTKRRIRNDDNRLVTEVTLQDGSKHQIVKLPSSEAMGLPGWYDTRAVDNDYLGSTEQEAIGELLKRARIESSTSIPSVVKTSAIVSTDLTPAQREDLAEEVERISGRMSQEEYDNFVEKHLTEDGDRVKRGAKHTQAARELLKKYGDSPVYRTIPQSPIVTGKISDAKLNGIVNDIEKALGGSLDITVLDDVTDIDNKEAPGSRAGGVIGGKVYLFRSGITDGIEGQKTIFHEVFHKGLRNLLPNAEYAALMTKLYNQSAAVRQAADAYLASEAGKKDTEKLSLEDARVLAVNEALAEMAEGTDLNGSKLRQLGNFFARLADRFGMPTLARAIRTMGMNPLQAFIRDAIQAGIQPSTETTETQFRTVTPQTEAAVAGIDVIGEKPEKSLADTLKRYQPLAIRMKAADSLAPIDHVFTKGYAGKVRDALGNLNPMVLVSRALDHARISLEALRTGSIAVKDGIVQAVELTIPEDSKEFGLIAGKTVNYQRDVIGRIASEAKEAGQSYKEYRKNIDTVLYGHREYNLREHNRQIEAQAQALEAAGKQKQADKLREDQMIELFIKDDAKLDELEAEFQRNIGIQEIGQVLDAIRFKALDTLVETNRLTPEQAQEYKDNIGYIPFDRIVEYEKAFNETRGKNRGIAALKNRKQIEGSGLQTTSVIENFSRLMDWATQESMKNQASLAALKDMVLLKLATRGANNTTGATGANITIYEKGVPTTFHVPDPAHVVALSLQEHQLSSVFKGLQKASQILRAGVTSLPPFAIKQIFDDISRAYVYSGVEQPLKLVGRILFNFPATWFREVFGMRHNASIREMARLGIIGSYDIGTQGNLKDILQEAGAEKRSTGRVILRVMEAGAKASDIAVRQAIFDQVLAETGDVAAAESRAREIINFSRKGSSKFMATMISVVPFFNAYARGMDKLAVAAAGKVVGQSTGQARAMFYKRMGYLTAMGLTYALMMADDDEYQKLPDHVRDTNWILPYGKELGFIPAIPIPAELAFFFKAIPERVVRYYKLQGTPEEQLAVEVLGNLAKRGVDVFSSPNLLAQGFRPFLENISNYSWFLGRPLESQGQLALDPFQRYGVGTSDTMKMVAEWLDEKGKKHDIDLIRISPIKLENAIRGIFGTAAGIALSIGDAIVNPTRTDRPLYQQMKAQLTGASALMKDPVGSRMIDEIYQLEKEVNQVNSTYNRLMEKDPAKVDDYVKRNVGLMSIRPAVTDLMKSIKSLDEEARLIDSTKEISGEARRKIINELKAQQNSLAKDVFALRTQARKIQQGM